MTTKLCKTGLEDVKLPNLGKEILEIKKRIQLSEGQRKALFEEIETKGKRDADEIQRLKKEIAATTIRLHEQRNNAFASLAPIIPSAKPSSAPCKRVTSQTSTTVRTVVSSGPSNRLKHSTSNANDKQLTLPALRTMLGGNIAQKTPDQILDHLDLQLIDKSKQLDLLNYKYKQKTAKLKALAEEYQKLLITKDGVSNEIEAIPENLKDEQAAKEYRNRINAAQVQIREAEHVQTRYKDIKWKLQEDAAKFQSKMQQIQEDLKRQNEEIEKIKQVNQEAIKLRNDARNALLREEKQVLAGNATREKQSTEGKRLLDARTADLEQLERYIYAHKPREQHQQEVIENGESGGDQDDDVDADGEDEEPPVDPEQELKDNIEVLKEATGSSCIEEVLAKVQGQTATQMRLMTLRRTKENVKNAKQKAYEQLLLELERLKFSEDKQSQLNLDEVEGIKGKINNCELETIEYKQKIEKLEHLLTKIIKKLLNSYLCLCQDDDTSADEEQDAGTYRFETPIELVQKLTQRIKQLKAAVDSGGADATVEEQLLEEIKEREVGNWLPGPYNDIIRRTPVPAAPGAAPSTTAAATTAVQAAASRVATGASEDEEEIPTRGYLKRQAQLVVDAKNKRKTMRFPIPKTK